MTTTILCRGRAAAVPGDLVEVYITPQTGSVNGAEVHPASGDTISESNSSEGVFIRGTLFRKTSATNWSVIRSA